MDQQPYQPRRTDYQSLAYEQRTRFVDPSAGPTPEVEPAKRDPADTTVQPVAADQSTNYSEQPPPPEDVQEATQFDKFAQTAKQPLDIDQLLIESVPLPHLTMDAPAQTHDFTPITDTHRMLETGVEGLLDAEVDDAGEIISGTALLSNSQDAAATTELPPIVNHIETDANSARPWQAPAPIVQKTHFYKTQKFWLAFSVILVIVLFIAGGIIGYKATHHAPDYKIPRPTVAPTDTSSVVASVGATTQEQSANQVRQKNILSLRTALEAYYVDNVMYPTNNQMADAKWAVANLRDIKLETLKDPEGTVAALTNMPTKLRYAYEAGANVDMTACDNENQNCNYYKLTVFLSDGTQYVKTALH